MTLDEPFAVVATGELDHGLAEILDVLIEARPQALLLERSDEALRTAVAGRLTGERGAV